MLRNNSESGYKATVSRDRTFGNGEKGSWSVWRFFCPFAFSNSLPDGHLPIVSSPTNPLAGYIWSSKNINSLLRVAATGFRSSASKRRLAFSGGARCGGRPRRGVARARQRGASPPAAGACQAESVLHERLGGPSAERDCARSLFSSADEPSQRVCAACAARTARRQAPARPDASRGAATSEMF